MEALWRFNTPKGFEGTEFHVCKSCLRTLKTEIAELIKKGELKPRKKSDKTAYAVVEIIDYEGSSIESLYTNEEAAKKRADALNQAEASMSMRYEVEPYELNTEAIL